MALHLIKLSVGVTDLDHLRQLQKHRLDSEGRLFHSTRMIPKRAEELLDGGSIFWVIKGSIQARQVLLDIVEETDEEGRFCRLILDPELISVQPLPKRAFQGWRYLQPQDAPADLPKGEAAEMPPEMLRELRELGLL